MAKRVTFSVERNTKRPKHLENNVYTLYLPERITLRPGEHKLVDIKIGITLLQNIQRTCILLPFALFNHEMEEFGTKYKTLDKEGNQKNSFHVTTTHNNCRSKGKIIVTSDTTASLM